MLKRILAISRKEIRQLKRDTRMLYVLFVFPFVLLVIFGYAINFDVHHIKMVVYDHENSETTRDFVYRLTSSNYFDLVGHINSEDQIRQVLDRGEAQVVLVFPQDFSRNIYSNKTGKIQILVAGIDANTASVISNYMNAATSTFSYKIAREELAVRGRSAYMPINLEPRFWFNPDLNSTLYLIPGLISLILIMTAVISIAMSIVREKRYNGTNKCITPFISGAFSRENITIFNNSFSDCFDYFVRWLYFIWGYDKRKRFFIIYFNLYISFCLPEPGYFNFFCV